MEKLIKTNKKHILAKNTRVNLANISYKYYTTLLTKPSKSGIVVYVNDELGNYEPELNAIITPTKRAQPCVKWQQVFYLEQTG